MPLLTKSFRERDPVKVGIAGSLGMLALLIALFGVPGLLQSLASSTYTAQFSDVGGLKPQAVVKLNGVEVGAVKSVEIEGEHVAVRFSVRNVGRLGAATRASVKASSLTGGMFLGIEPAGPGRLPSGSVIPVQRTDPPYDVTNALATLSRTSELNRALNTLSDTLANTPAPLRGSLEGLSRLSRTLGSRDVALRELLGHANSVTGVLAQRSDDIIALVTEGNQLVAALNGRREVIQQLLGNVTATIEQLNGLVKDNQRQLGPTLEQLKGVLDLLNRNDRNIAATIHGLNTYAGSLGEAVGGGPWFFAFIQNLPPTNFVPELPLGAKPVPGLFPPPAAVPGGPGPASSTGAGR
jgi:phospholipid/cholesterol/gamma-HCH transport system substrate-binding protein